MDPIPRLACQQCKQRKIKCDKGAPCSACRNAGLSCHAIQRARLPRGKTAKSRSANTNMETRITRIERLLQEYKKVIHSSIRDEVATNIAVDICTDTAIASHCKGCKPSCVEWIRIKRNRKGRENGRLCGSGILEIPFSRSQWFT